MTSYPDMEDSDEDGLYDDEDPDPLKPTIFKMFGTEAYKNDILLQAETIAGKYDYEWYTLPGDAFMDFFDSFGIDFYQYDKWIAEYAIDIMMEDVNNYK